MSWDFVFLTIMLKWYQCIYCWYEMGNCIYPMAYMTCLSHYYRYFTYCWRCSFWIFHRQRDLEIMKKMWNSLWGWTASFLLMDVQVGNSSSDRICRTLSISQFMWFLYGFLLDSNGLLYPIFIFDFVRVHFVTPTTLKRQLQSQSEVYSHSSFKCVSIYKSTIIRCNFVLICLFLACFLMKVKNNTTILHVTQDHFQWKFSI